MRRFDPPFNGKRFLLNKSTGEIHDLDNEAPNCQIESISPDNIRMDDSYMNCLIAAAMFSPCKRANGCHYCLKEKDID